MQSIKLITGVIVMCVAELLYIVAVATKYWKVAHKDGVLDTILGLFTYCESSECLTVYHEWEDLEIDIRMKAVYVTIPLALLFGLIAAVVGVAIPVIKAMSKTPNSHLYLVSLVASFLSAFANIIALFMFPTYVSQSAPSKWYPDNRHFQNMEQIHFSFVFYMTGTILMPLGGILVRSAI